MSPRISFIGFGEAGQAMAEGLRQEGLREEGVSQIAAWDILFPEACGRETDRGCEQGGRARRLIGAEDAMRDADIVIAAVTAASSFEAAQSVAPHLQGRPFYLDVNSVSPGRKQATAKLLGDSARYVDVAIVSAIHPSRHKSPMMLAGSVRQRSRAPARLARHENADRGRQGRRCGRDQDDPQRDDQGHRGTDRRMLPRRLRAPAWSIRSRRR